MKNKYLVFSLATLAWIIPAFVYYMFNPTNSDWAVKCTFHELTSLNCPGCGGQRSIHYLLNGEILTALRHNFIYVLGIPFFLYLYYFTINMYVLKKGDAKNNFIFTAKFGLFFVVFVFLFFVLRNIPMFPFTLLSPP